MIVTVRLKNPPAGATKWAMSVIDWNMGGILSWYGTELPPEYNNISEVATFDIPATWSLPLRIVLQINKYILWEGQPAFQQLYRVQSFRPGSDYYKEVFIPELGSYYYNVATEQFEAKEVPPPGVGLALYAGGNFVVYTGRAQASLVALDSIAPYLDPDYGVWYWNNYTYEYEIMESPLLPGYYERTDMVPYGCYWIEVTQNCTWTYGPEETAPTSVYLWADRYNIVAYSGPEQSIEAAFASIIDFRVSWFYSDKGLWTQPSLMVPNGVYAVWVRQACEWIFEVEVPPVVPCEITITAPNSAAEGETVSVAALLENVSSYGSMYKIEISAVPDLYPAFRIGTIEKYINSGATFTAYGSFTMPDCNVTILIWVERWAVDHWVYDNSASKVISLEVPATYHLDILVPSWAAGGYVEPGSGDYEANSTVVLTAHPLSGYQFTGWGRDASGTALTYNLLMNSDKNVEAYFEKVPVPIEGSIIKKELEFSGSGDGTVPVSDVPQGVSAKLHVWGKNEMATSQGMGIYWFVADKDGEIAEEYSDWGGVIGAGKDHEFISSGSFVLNKVGKYTAWIELLMGTQDNPEMVVLDIGDLCTVVAELVPEFTELKISSFEKR